MFYLGYTKLGVIRIIVTVVTCGTGGSIWALIDFVRILIGSIRTDAKGNPLI